MSFLRANLAALEQVLGVGLTLPENDGRFRLDTTGQNPVLLLSAPQGGSVALNSRRDPIAEARKQLEGALKGGADPDVVVVIGIGLGFVIDAVEQQFPAAKILALEPEPGGIRFLLDRRDLSSLLNTGRLRLLWGPDYLGASDTWQLLEGPEDARVTVVHPSLSRLRPDSTLQAMKQFERMLFGARSNAEARKKFAGQYLLNTLRNLPVIARSGDVGSLFGLFRGVPGILISAGPSLDRNIDELRDVQDRAVLVAVDTALRPLLSAGVHPHLVVAVDPAVTNADHLRDLPSTGRTCLVAEGSVDPTAFEEFGDRVFTFRVGSHHPWPWLQEQGLTRALLRAWGSVATSAFDLTLSLGCDPVIFLGQDLAFTGDQPYCRGTTFEFDWADRAASGIELADIWQEWLSRAGAVTVPDVSGGSTTTTATLVAFRDWLVEQCGAVPDRTFVNATGAGILFGPLVCQMRLGEALHGRPSVSDAWVEIEAARRRSCETEAALRLGSVKPTHGVVETWRRFGGESLRVSDVLAALSATNVSSDVLVSSSPLHLSRHVMIALKNLGGLAPRTALPPSAERRERMAAVKALATCGEHETSPGRREQTPGPRQGMPLRRATSALCRLLALEEPVRGLAPGFERLSVGLPSTVSLTAPFDWSSTAQDDVDLLERLVREAHDGASSNEWDRQSTFRWSVAPHNEPPLETAPDAVLPVSREALQWWARRALVIEWALLAAATPGVDEHIPGIASGLSVWLRNLADRACPVPFDQSSTVLVVEVAEAMGLRQSFRFELRTPLSRLMRGLTGLVVPSSGQTPEARPSPVGAGRMVMAAAANGREQPMVHCRVEWTGPRLSTKLDPRTRFLGPERGWLVPTVLDIPAAYRVSALDSATAIVTPFMASQSLAVSADGTTRTLPRWPQAVVGEVRGPGGHCVAWCSGASWYLMRRRTEQGKVEFAVPPFRPTRAVVLEDGTTFLSAQTGGLWRWDISGVLTCVATVPPCAALHLRADGIRLDPNLPGRDKAWDQTGQDLAWLWRFDTGSLDSIVLEDEGPMWRLAQGNGIWAAAYPAADTIRFGIADSAFDLACDCPIDLAWAGDTLLAATGAGTVLRFGGVRSQFS